MKNIPFSTCKKTDPHYLYILKDPFTFKIKWVGITNNIRNRKKDHLTNYSNYIGNPSLLEWKETLKGKNAYPLFEVIKEYKNYNTAHQAEIKLIEMLSGDVLNIFHKLITPQESEL
jgi:hypothetical protein